MNVSKTDFPQLLVLGGPSSGKTTYRTQLYQRIEHTHGELRLHTSVADMSALAGDVERIVNGLQPLHTHPEVYKTTSFSIIDKDDRTLKLEFADYGGEQVRRIGEMNALQNPWVLRAKHSSSWLFLLRIDSIRAAKSFITDPVRTGPHLEAISSSCELHERPAELCAIETLQRLLFVRGTSLRNRLEHPRLAVLLSCWDELTPAERKLRPGDILKTRAPLFSSFIHSNWRQDELKVWGLSSTERKLPEETPDLEFARKGPEHFGYVVLEDGIPSPDLTLPVNWLIPKN